MSDFKVVSILNPTVVLTGGPIISAGTSAQNGGTVVFSNSNNVSFGLSNGVMTASAAGGGGGGVAISAGTNSTSTGTVVFSNANGVSFGMDTNGVVTGTVATNYQSQGAYLTTAMASNNGSNFVQATAAFFGTNASGTIASNAISVSVNAGGGGGVAISAGTNSTSTGTVVFSNANGVSFGMETNGVVTATVKTDYLTSQSVQTQASGAIAGTGFTSTTTAGTAITAALGTNGLSMAVPQYITTYVNDLTSGRAGTGFTSTTTAGTAITAALGTNGLSMAVPQFLTTAMQSNAVTISNINVSAGTTSNNLSALTFSNSNGVSFGLNGSVITGTVATNYQSQGAYLTTAMASNRGSDFVQATAAFAGTNASGTIASNGISVSVGNYITTARASNDAVGLNTAQSNVTWTVNSSGVSLDARGYAGTGLSLTNATATLNSNGLQLSVGGGGVTNQTGPNISAGTDSLFTSGTVTFGNNGFGSHITSNGSVVFKPAIGTDYAMTNLAFTSNTDGISINNVDDHLNAWELEGNNTAGTTASTLTTKGPIYFSGGPNITLSGNSNTIVVSAAAGGGGATHSYFDNLGPLNTISGALGTKQVQINQVQLFPLNPYVDVFNGAMTINTMLFEASVSGSTATLSAAGISTVLRFGLYTIVTSGASLSAGIVNSFQATYGVAAANTNNSQSWNGQRILSVHSSQWSAQPALSDNVQYVCGIHWSSIGSSAQTFAMIGGFMGSTAARSGYLVQASANATHNGMYGPFLGVYGTTTAALPTGINITQVNKQSASANFIPHIIGHNFTNLTMM